jgi:two-component system response regulator QseB
MRLLVVEDDVLLGEALATGLRQLGHAVDWFADGASADAALAGAAFDAVVLDLGSAAWRRHGVAARWRERG